MSNVTVVKGEGPRSGGSSNTSLSKLKQQFEDQPWREIGQSERIVSGIAGVGLASMAMRSHSFLRAILMLGGAAGMAHRAYTGRCGFGRVASRMSGMLSEQTGSSQQSSGRSQGKLDQVREASEESFPASDSPSFTPVTGSASTETSSSQKVGSSSGRTDGNNNSNSTTKAGSSK